MIKVLIVDDSMVIRDFMSHILSSDPEIKVVGTASSGEEAIAQVYETRPDVITMDIHMPGMDGYEATRVIMETIPTPIVIVTGSLRETEISNSFKLIEAGALSVVLRPSGIEDSGFASARKELVSNIKLMSEIKVVKRFPNQMKSRIPYEQRIPKHPSSESNEIKLVAIGASTGGPIVIQTILSNLSKDFPVPVVIVQHISKGFLNGLKDWLSTGSNLVVEIAREGESLQPGHAYLAPDDLQMGILSENSIALRNLPAENSLCPSVDFLFRSVAEVLGPKAVGVLLTGMGKDGAKELLNMKKQGAITIAQDEASCVVFGMPGEAVKIGAVVHLLSPVKIAQTLSEICAKKHRK